MGTLVARITPVEGGWRVRLVVVVIPDEFQLAAAAFENVAAAVVVVVAEYNAVADTDTDIDDGDDPAVVAGRDWSRTVAVDICRWRV
jgi:hypothetical protein